jgi:hypothetical protein
VSATKREVHLSTTPEPFHQLERLVQRRAVTGRFSSRQIDVDIVDIVDFRVDFARFAGTPPRRSQLRSSTDRRRHDPTLAPSGQCPTGSRLLMWRHRLVCALLFLLFARHACGAQLHPAWLLWALLPGQISAGAVSGALAAGPLGCAVGGGLAGLVHLHDIWRRFEEPRLREHHPTQSPFAAHVRTPPTPMRRFDRKVNFAEMRDFLSDNEFRLKYGLNPAAFDHVLDLIKADITDVPGGHGGIRNSAIVPPEVKLAVTLRWLRGAAYHDLYYEWGMSRSTFYRTWLRVCRAIMKQPSLALKLPQAIAAWKQGDSSMLSTLAAGFGRFTDGIFNFCVGAIDGVQIKINRPRATEDPAPNSYYTRRGIHALNVQAVADDRGSIIWASIRAPGAMHDSQVRVTCMHASHAPPTRCTTPHPSPRLPCRHSACRRCFCSSPRAWADGSSWGTTPTSARNTSRRPSTARPRAARWCAPLPWTTYLGAVLFSPAHLALRAAGGQLPVLPGTHAPAD